MAHSLSHDIPLTCLDCKQVFESAVWLIVDGEERPDLLRRLIGDTLHDVTCPNNHHGKVNAALLLLRPNADFPLLFIPPLGESEEESQRRGWALVEILRERAGEDWQDRWLTDGLSVISRAPLLDYLRREQESFMAENNRQRNLANPPEVEKAIDEICAILRSEGIVINSSERLLQALNERPDLQSRLERAQEESAKRIFLRLADFITAETESDAYQLLHDHPELLSDRVSKALEGLLEVARDTGDEIGVHIMTERANLLRRVREAGT